MRAPDFGGARQIGQHSCHHGIMRHRGTPFVDVYEKISTALYCHETSR